MYLFGCFRSWLLHMESSLLHMESSQSHIGTFTVMGVLSGCGMQAQLLHVI